MLQQLQCAMATMATIKGESKVDSKPSLKQTNPSGEGYTARFGQNARCDRGNATRGDPSSAHTACAAQARSSVLDELTFSLSGFDGGHCLMSEAGQKQSGASKGVHFHTRNTRIIGIFAVLLYVASKHIRIWCFPTSASSSKV